MEWYYYKEINIIFNVQEWPVVYVKSGWLVHLVEIQVFEWSLYVDLEVEAFCKASKSYRNYM